jgi:alkylation response protein AidB-like acyl-CoA dehydrogenase
MNHVELRARLKSILATKMPVPASGQTPQRHRNLFEFGRENLSFARLAEAHWDAVAILREVGRAPHPSSIYAVWASEKAGLATILDRRDGNFTLSGSKMFCSGAGIADRALVSVSAPQQQLVDVDLRTHAELIKYDHSEWITSAFKGTRTATVNFTEVPIPFESLIGGPGGYLFRAGFWHSACGPAACWAGGIAGLVDFALLSDRKDPHTLAHLAAMHSNVWAMESYLETSGREIDSEALEDRTAKIQALRLRHLIEQASSDTLRRFARAYGPYPMSMNSEVSQRYMEADLYLRQSHAERDLETLAVALRPAE